jgi:hypothetical protein
MLNMKSQYVNLGSGPNKIADNSERKYVPEIRTVYLSGRPRRLFEENPQGIPILESGREGRTPILDHKRILNFLLYGLGFGLVVTGAVFLFDKRRGE